METITTTIKKKDLEQGQVSKMGKAKESCFSLEQLIWLLELMYVIMEKTMFLICQGQETLQLFLWSAISLHTQLYEISWHLMEKVWHQPTFHCFFLMRKPLVNGSFFRRSFLWTVHNFKTLSAAFFLSKNQNSTAACCSF